MRPSLIPTNTVLKIVVDTNQFLSGFIYHGMTKIVFDLVLDSKLKLYVSPALKEEISKKLYEFEINERAQNEIKYFIETRGILTEPVVKVDICRDPKDNFILELAEETQADYLITRDKDLLELPGGEWKDTKIIRPEEFLPFLRSLQLI